MKKQIKLVEDFHKKFKGPIGLSPELISEDQSDFRHKIMAEEVKEYFEGAQKGDLKNISKELCDILYTVYGTIVAHGLQDVIEDIFDEVHGSNMSKDYSGSEGQKAIKGNAYYKADMNKFIK